MTFATPFHQKLRVTNLDRATLRYKLPRLRTDLPPTPTAQKTQTIKPAQTVPKIVPHPLPRRAILQPQPRKPKDGSASSKSSCFLLVLPASSCLPPTSDPNPQSPSVRARSRQRPSRSSCGPRRAAGEPFPREALGGRKALALGAFGSAWRALLCTSFISCVRGGFA